MAGRRKTYTAKELEEAVDRYFRTISRSEVMTERVERVIGGEIKVEEFEVRNDNGEPVMRTKWLQKPKLTSLYLFLGIDKSTWSRYADAKENPKHAKICEYAKLRCEEYLEDLVITKEKGVQGVIFNLQYNFGWKERHEIDIGANARAASLTAGMSAAEKIALIREAAELVQEGGAAREDSAADE